MKIAKLTLVSVALMLLLTVIRPVHAIERTVVLRNGNVVHGEIERRSGDIVVRSGSAIVSISHDDVELIARDLHDAYQQKSALVGGPNSRVSLIRWCIKVGLPEQASAELARLLERVPDDPRCEVLARQIDSYRLHVSNVLPTNSHLPHDTQIANQHLDQLSRDSLADFSRTIQPLMFNRCAQAGCHGKGGAAKFELIQGPSMSVNLNRRNLGATLRMLGRVPAEQTLLWTSANAPHGGLTDKAMSPDELRRLFEWIDRVVSDLGSAEESRVAFASAQQPLAGAIPMADPRAIANGVDPFDPSEFNQRYFPTTTTVTTATPPSAPATTSTPLVPAR